MKFLSHKPLKFFLLLFVISIPLWVLGALAESLAKILPINLPISALMFVCPTIAALILVRQENKPNSMRELLIRTFDYKKIKNKIWYAPVILIMPVVLALSYGLMRLLGLPLPEPYIPLGAIPVFFLMFFVGAAGEEIGWSGYVIDRLQDRWNALEASIIAGFVWAIWHIVGWFQVPSHPNPIWVAWQFAFTVTVRIIIVWLYNNTGKSVFAAILFHTMINVSDFLFPNYGSHYDPFFAFIIILVTAVIVIFLWGTETLARYRYASLSESDIKR